MNQPKFKFGDKVAMKKSEPCYINNSTPFKVVKIAYCKHNEDYEVHGEDNWIYEKEAELFVEPEKKKLYAYWYLVGQYRSVTLFENLITDNCLTYSHFHRCEEYDIEYPETKVD